MTNTKNATVGCECGDGLNSVHKAELQCLYNIDHRKYSKPV